MAADEYATIVGKVTPAVITCKPIALGGSLGRDPATARGGFYLLRHLETELGVGPGSRVAIQGFGNAGSHMARLLRAAGYKVIAVSDSRAAVGASDGLDIEALLEAKRTSGLQGLAGTNGITALDPHTIVGVDCEILVPAALENLIHRDNAGDVRAKVVLELAYGPLTPEADDILSANNVIVLPDILANAVAVTVSYFEWVQNRQGYYWTVSEIHDRLKAGMEAEGRAIWALSASRGISMRSAAYVHALQRLAEATEAHGTQQFFTS
ncbi:Glu/Leu/Phe/Val family dehydrogenase [Tardibacter chloracetimidivorans]|uniref:Glu/Leu/Phe/Val family dehydrogenase n=1 Tax=Tardibacter chloracetimidivorans TaxID=1921510 RepID=UPI001D047C78|nr:glutamate dehydrogenase [Tardibacter chloracetimidivorans]